MTGEPISQAEAQALERAYLLGLARAPLPLPVALQGKLAAEAAPLGALALMTQRARFERPLAVKDRLSRERLLPDDPRPILPPSLRSELLRLLTTGDRNATAWMAPALFGLVSAHGFRLHPFDLPRIETWLRKAEQRLGRGERAYLAGKRQEPEPTSIIAFGRPIGDGNWREFPKRERLAFLRERRAGDPEGARRLIEAALPEAPAPMRAELLQLLALRLGAEDRALLEASERDRAAGVREIAQQLLARLPGTPAYAERVARAAGAFSLGRGGLLRQRAALSFDAPGKRGTEQDAAIMALLDGIALTDLAAGVHLSPEEFVAALPSSSRGLHLAFLRIVLSEARIALIPSLAKAMTDAEWPVTLEFLEEEFARLPPAARRAASEAIFLAQPAAQLPPAPSWAALEALQEGPFAPDVVATLLSSEPWHNFLKTAASAEGTDATTSSATLLAIATLIPAVVADRLVAALAPLPDPITASAIQYARFAQAIAAASGGAS